MPRRPTLVIAVAACLLITVGVAGAAPQAGEATLLSQSWAKMQTASLYGKWKRQNPVEASKLEPYWASGGTAPVLATAFGKALVLEAQAYWSLTTIPPPPPAPACSDGLDNDGDGKIDLADPGCSSSTDTDEADVAPPPPTGCALPAFPDASCTGVPSGTVLSPSGSITVSTAGAIIAGRDISGSVTVNAPNVTIRNTRIRGNAMFLVANNSTGLLIEDSELINQRVTGNNCHVGVGSANFTVRRTEITGCENGFNVTGNNVTITDNYVHDLDTVGPSYVFGNSPHTDGIQIGAAQFVTITHNTIDPVGAVVGGGATSGIITDVYNTNVDANAHLHIENNYIDGREASVAIYAPRVQTADVLINGNRLYKGVYGIYTFCVKVGTTVTQFNDNRDAGTGTLIAPDNGVGGGCTN